jgi:hypothetical protein
MFTIESLMDLLDMSDLDEDRKHFVKVNLENLHNVYRKKYNSDLVL